MPSRRYDGTKPWAARVRLSGVTYWLGYHQRYSQAEQTEEEFKQALFDITTEAEHLWRVKHGYAG